MSSRPPARRCVAAPTSAAPPAIDSFHCPHFGQAKAYQPDAAFARSLPTVHPQRTLPLPPASPTTQAKACQPDAAFATYRRMLAAGASPNSWTFSMLISACGRARQPARAAEVVERLMPQVRFTPFFLVSFSWRVAACGDDGVTRPECACIGGGGALMAQPSWCRLLGLA